MIDEGFDFYDLQMADDLHIAPLHKLNAKLGALISLPLTERVSNGGLVKRTLSVDELQSLNEFIPRSTEEPAKNVWFLREALRDKLHDLLLRLDHCSEEQLFSRFVILPPDRELSLFHLNQLVLHLASTGVENARRYATSGT
jgi:hypothetical protein